MKRWPSCICICICICASGRRLAAAATLLLLAACGGGGGGASTPEPPLLVPAVLDARLALGNGPGHQTVLQAVPAASGSGTGATPATLTIHYKRPAGDYAGWALHTWDAALETSWAAGRAAAGTDSFGQIYQVPLAASSGSLGYSFHQGDDKDHGGADQRHTLTAGANEIWRIQGDTASFSRNPDGAARPDISTVRVHCRRFDAAYAAWGLHLWAVNGIDSARLPAGLAIEQWGSPVAFNAMPGQAAGAGEVVSTSRC